MLHPTSKELCSINQKDFGGIDSVIKSVAGLTSRGTTAMSAFYSNGWLRAHSTDVVRSRPGALAAPWRWLPSKCHLQISDFEQPKVFYNALCDLEKRRRVVSPRAVQRSAGRPIRRKNRAFDPRLSVHIYVLAKIDPNSNALHHLIATTHGSCASRTFRRVSLLHFLESEAKGGLSTFVDGLASSQP